MDNLEGEKPSESSLSPKRQLEIATLTWKAFLSGHADECDTDAVVDLMVSETASIIRLECAEEKTRFAASVYDSGFFMAKAELTLLRSQVETKDPKMTGADVLRMKE